MKKTIKLILIISFIFTSLIGCNKKEILLDPIAEIDIAQYLAGKDPIIDDNYSGTYTIVSRTCDKKTDDLVVTYNGSSTLFDYQAKYQVKSSATNNGWVIDSFEIVDSKHEIKNIPASVFKDLLDGVDKNVTSDMKGSYSVVSQELKDDVVKFVVKYVSDSGKYSAEYDGEAIVKDGKLELQKVVINTTSSDDTSSESGKTTLSKNYDPNKKAKDYGYKAPSKPVIEDEHVSIAKLIEEYKPGFKVVKVKYLSTAYGVYCYEVTLEDRYQYVTDVEVWKFYITFVALKYNITKSEKISGTTISNFEGVYVNKANGSYIIMHSDWKFELHEFYMDGSTIKKIVLKEYHSISGADMTWKNRDYAFKSVWTNGTEPTGFSITIQSINELKLNSNILSSKSGDVFVKVP